MKHKYNQKILQHRHSNRNMNFLKNFFSFICMGVLGMGIQAISANKALAYVNEVRASGSNYIWRINDVDQGNTSSLATAINNCIGTGNREVHILSGGTLSERINLQPGLTLYCHNVTFNKNHTADAFFRDGSGPIRIYDMTLNNNAAMGIRISRASDVYIQNVKIYGGGIGIRVDSHPSRPYEEGRWVSNLHVQDCRFENGSSHGLETYGVDGFKAYGIIARNMGECGVLLNKTINGTLGTVDAYRCSYGGGYAGLRLANNCSNVTTEKLIARECGRGYFVLTGSNNSHLNNAQITDCTDIGIWLENVINCSVKAGCTNDGVAVSGSGSYANVSNSCSTSSTYYQIRNRGTGLYLDGMGRTTNGSACGQYANTTHVNSQWERISTGSYYQFRNRGTGLFLDGMGLTANGADLGQWANTTHVNSQWSVLQYSGSYNRIQNRGTGLFIDGMGRTTNGSATGQWANTTSVNAQWELIPVSGSSIAFSAAGEELKLIENEPSGDLKAYPNPVSDVLNISLPSASKNGAAVTLLDAAGRMVHKGSISGTSHELSVKSLGAGFYFLIVEDGTKVFKEKIVVQ